MQRAIPASFWRGGTSRGLLLRSSTLSSYPPPIRNQIILTALGSPDPNGRQISGLGGGVSSLSKVAIIGAPGEGLEDQRKWGRLPGVEWADEGKELPRLGEGEQRERKVDWDVVYRFGQVSVRSPHIDWTTTCGNLLSAVALSALSSPSPILPYSTLFDRARLLPPPPPSTPLLFPLRILSAANGIVMTVRVPLDPLTLQVWELGEGEGERIAGVPEVALGLRTELPIDGGGDGGLVTGRSKDSIEFEGVKIDFSILTTGLPNIFLPLSHLLTIPSLSFLLSSTSPLLTLSPSHPLLSHPHLTSTLSLLRTSIATSFSLPLSLASPKLTLIDNVPKEGYETSAGEKVERGEADLLVRSISSGDWHASIPGTTLGALNIGVGLPGTVISDLLLPSTLSPPPPPTITQEEVISIRAAHLAGVATSSVKFLVNKEGGRRRPDSVVMMRTAREIMRGEVLVPEKVFEGLGTEEEERRWV